MNRVNIILVNLCVGADTSLSDYYQYSVLGRHLGGSLFNKVQY